MKKLLILGIIFMTVAACSSKRVLVHPQAINDQKITYDRGGVKLHSQSILKPEITILDYSFDEMIIGLSVTNLTPDTILFSEQNVSVELLAEEQLEAATVYSFNQLAEEAAESGQSTAGQVGETAVGIGVGFIPFGGIAYSVGKMFYDIGSNSDGHEKRIDQLTFSQLNKNYLRQQTIDPGSSYSGILKIGFEENLKEGDTLIFQVSAGSEVEKFSFTCKNPPEQ